MTDKNLGGAPPGNLNAVTSGVRTDHGLTVDRFGLTLPRLPAGRSWIHRKASRLRRALEAEVIEARGRVTLPDLATIRSACACLIDADLSAKWLQQQGDDLPHETRQAYKANMRSAALECERAIHRLRIGPSTTDGDDPLASLWASQAAGVPNGGIIHPRRGERRRRTHTRSWRQ